MDSLNCGAIGRETFKKHIDQIIGTPAQARNIVIVLGSIVHGSLVDPGIQIHDAVFKRRFIAQLKKAEKGLGKTAKELLRLIESTESKDILRSSPSSEGELSEEKLEKIVEELGQA